MHIKKQFVVILLLVIAIGVVASVFMKKQMPADIVLEEEIADLPQKSSISLDTYLPIVKDNIWHYENKKNDSTLTSWVEFIDNDVMQVRFSDGEKSFVKVYIAEEEAIYEVAKVEDVSIKENYTTLRQYKNIVLKLPLVVGNSWVLSDGAVRTISKIGEDYETPIGIQKGIEITTSHDDYKVKEIYAEKIGLIKMDYTSDKTVQNFELTKFENNTAREEQVTLYIAKKKSGILNKIEQNISVMTNEEPRHFLTDLLNKVMGTEYITTISNGAIIDKIFLDDEDCLYVEMSQDFMDPIYNQEEQKGVIMSLAQTLGHYYSAKYVTISIDGEIYPVKDGQADAKGRIRVLGGAR